VAFVLIAVGVILFVTAYQGTTGTLGSMLVQDVIGTQGTKGFLYWAVAILVIGAIGYIQKLKGLSDAFVALLLLVLFIGNKGFFAKFNQALGTIGQGGAAAQTGAAANTTSFLLNGQPGQISTGIGAPVLQTPGMSVPFNILGSGGGLSSLGSSSDTGWFSVGSDSGSGWTDVDPSVSPGGWVDVPA
jgi:hypothetical protein